MLGFIPMVSPYFGPRYAGCKTVNLLLQVPQPNCVLWPGIADKCKAGVWLCAIMHLHEPGDAWLAGAGNNIGCSVWLCEGLPPLQ